MERPRCKPWQECGVSFLEQEFRRERAEMPTPAELRDQANRAHRLARATSDEQAAEGLERYATELEAKADALEAGEDQAEHE
jgi:hypothetical protein